MGQATLAEPGIHSVCITPLPPYSCAIWHYATVWFVWMRSIMKYGTNTDSDFWQFVAKRHYLKGGQKSAKFCRL
jgi:hypothetical protein